MAISSFLLVSSCKNSTRMEKAAYTGDNISDVASIIRDKNSKAAFLEIETADAWSLYAGTTVETIDFSTSIAEGIGSGVFPLNVPDSVRFYFQLITDKGAAILAERQLPMSGGYNFRDLGGIKNAEGKYVKWGKVFRTDDLHHLTENDLSYLAGIPLTSVVDFRSEEEMQKGPDKLPKSVENHYLFSINPGNLMTAVTDVKKITEKDADNLMMRMNELLVSDSACVKQYRHFFSLLQNEENIPLLFHCSAGKDRTGMAAALFLFSLGVDEKIILDDYLSSNVYLEDKYAEFSTVNPALKSLFEVKPEFLQAGLDRIKKEHESIENYLTKVLNVNTERMKVLYLY